MVLEWVWWKTERRHTELGAIAYRRLFCKHHYRRVQEGRRDKQNQPCLSLIGGEQKWLNPVKKQLGLIINCYLSELGIRPRPDGSRLCSQGYIPKAVFPKLCLHD
jgi:hypothetical protein